MTALPPNFRQVWPGAVSLLDAMLDGKTPEEALDDLTPDELPTTPAQQDVWCHIATGEAPMPLVERPMPGFMLEAEARAPLVLQDPSEFERYVMRKVVPYPELTAMHAQAVAEARDYPEAEETRHNRLGALRKALDARVWESGRTYRAPVFRPPRAQDGVRVTREQWEAIDRLDADTLAQSMGLKRIRKGIECPLHREHEAKVYRSRRGPVHWQCFRADQGGGALELYAAMTRGGIPTNRDERRAVAAEMVAAGLA